MAGGAKDLIAADVRKLITHLTGFSETDDSHNFKLCEQFTFSNLLNHRYLSVDGHAVRRSIFGMVTKFMIHGHLEASRKLDSLLNKFLNNSEIGDKDLQWSILKLLLKLSNNPTNHLVVEQNASAHDVKKEEFSKTFDWTTYSHMCSFVQEDNEKFNTDFNASSDNEDWEELNSSSSELVSPPPEDVEVDSKPSDAPELEVSSVTSTRHDQFVEVQRRQVAAENYLSNNVQQPWWLSDRRDEEVDDEFSANFCRIVHGIENPHSESPAIISEYKMVREVLWMFHSPTTNTAFRKSKNGFSVQPNLSISSITKERMHGFLNQFCQYFDMLQNINEFGQCIQITPPLPSTENQNKLPSRTFEAYSSALKEFVLELQELAVDIEKKVIRQGEIYTVGILARELSPKLNQLSVVHRVHQKATKDWKGTPNFIAAPRLLSVLYFETLLCVECDRPCQLLRLFLKSLRPYVEIINTWLCEGNLDDDREEFIVFKRNYCDGGIWNDGYTVRPYVEEMDQRGVRGLPLLRIIATKVLHAGRTVQLLQRLDRVGDMVKNARAGEMFLEFLEELDSCMTRNRKEHTCSPSKTQAIAENESSEILDSPKPLKIVQLAITEVAARLENLNDEFLMKAYREYFVPKILERQSSGSCCSSINASSGFSKYSQFLPPINAAYRRLAGHGTCGMMPLGTMMERIITDLIETKHEAASLHVKNIFMQEFALLTHLKLIRAIYLMEAGDVMHPFSLYIFKELESKVGWTNPYSLTLMLEECINLRYPEHTSKFSISLRNDAPLNGTPSVMDEIVIKYAVDWPLNMILTPMHMETYSLVFQFLLKVKWALWCLEDIRFSELGTKRTSENPIIKKRTRLLHLLRFWLIHAVGSIHSYLMGQVLHSLGIQLEKELATASDLDSLVHFHNNYVNLIYTHCLQPQRSDVIKTAILQLVRLSLQLRELWCQKVKNIEDSELGDMVEMYIKCHYFLGSVLQNFVDSGYSPHYEMHTAPSLSSFPAPNGLEVEFSENFKYSLSCVAWQIGLPTGLPSCDELPKSLHKYLKTDLWNEDEREASLSKEHSKLEGFLNNYFEYMRGQEEPTSVPCQSLFHVPSDTNMDGSTYQSCADAALSEIDEGCIESLCTSSETSLENAAVNETFSPNSEFKTSTPKMKSRVDMSRTDGDDTENERKNLEYNRNCSLEASTTGSLVRIKNGNKGSPCGNCEYIKKGEETDSLYVDSRISHDNNELQPCCIHQTRPLTVDTAKDNEEENQVEDIVSKMSPDMLCVYRSASGSIRQKMRVDEPNIPTLKGKENHESPLSEQTSLKCGVEEPHSKVSLKHPKRSSKAKLSPNLSSSRGVGTKTRKESDKEDSKNIESLLSVPQKSCLPDSSSVECGKELSHKPKASVIGESKKVKDNVENCGGTPFFLVSPNEISDSPPGDSEMKLHLSQINQIRKIIYGDKPRHLEVESTSSGFTEKLISSDFLEEEPTNSSLNCVNSGIKNEKFNCVSNEVERGGNTSTVSAGNISKLPLLSNREKVYFNSGKTRQITADGAKCTVGGERDESKLKIPQCHSNTLLIDKRDNGEESVKNPVSFSSHLSSSSSHFKGHQKKPSLQGTNTSRVIQKTVEKKGNGVIKDVKSGESTPSFSSVKSSSTPGSGSSKEDQGTENKSKSARSSSFSREQAFANTLAEELVRLPLNYPVSPFDKKKYKEEKPSKTSKNLAIGKKSATIKHTMPKCPIEEETSPRIRKRPRDEKCTDAARTEDCRKACCNIKKSSCKQMCGKQNGGPNATLEVKCDALKLKSCVLNHGDTSLPPCSVKHRSKSGVRTTTTTLTRTEVLRSTNAEQFYLRKSLRTSVTETDRKLSCPSTKTTTRGGRAKVTANNLKQAELE